MRDLGLFQSKLEAAFKKNVDITFLGNNDPYLIKVVNKEKIIIYENN